jgi:hypothetical protein
VVFVLEVAAVFRSGIREELRAAAWQLEPTPELCAAIPRHAPIVRCFACHEPPVPHHALCARCANALDLEESRYLSTLQVYA